MRLERSLPYVYDVETNGTNGHANPASFQSKYPPGGNRGLIQAYLFRDTSAEQVLVLKDQPATNDLKDLALRARTLRDLAAVWDNACERLRILRGRPLPGSLKPKAPARKRKVPTGPLFSMDDDVRTDSPTSAPTDVPPQP